MENITSDKWMGLTKPYQKPVNAKSWWQVVNSFGPFVFFWALTYLALQVSVWLMLLLAFVAALFGLRIFIIQHDCGHGSFLKNYKWRDRLGFVCSLATMVPYRCWQWEHAQHHAHSGNLDHRDLGEMKVLTAEEFLALSRVEQINYRIYRFPPLTFLVGPALVFFLGYRWPEWKVYKGQKRIKKSILLTDLYLLAIFVVGIYTLGWEFAAVHFVIIYFTAVMGVWMFYVQHQFEDGYWQKTQNWNPAEAAVHGSSYFKLPRVLQWFTGNIGFHHIHHLNLMIPNYELEHCYNENKILQDEVTTLTLANCWETMKLKFWDEKLNKMITWPEMKALYLSK